jgi:hypothetical protein
MLETDEIPWQEVHDTVSIQLATSTMFLESILNGCRIITQNKPTSKTVEEILTKINELRSIDTPNSSVGPGLWTVINFWKRYLPYQLPAIRFKTGRDIRIKFYLNDIWQSSGPILHDLLIPAFNYACDIIEYLLEQYSANNRPRVLHIPCTSNKPNQVASDSKTRCKSYKKDDNEKKATCSAQELIAVITNQLLVVAKTLIGSRNELEKWGVMQDEYAAPSIFIVNGQMASAILAMQAVQDAIATFCQQQAPDDTIVGLFYFSSYPFRVTEYEFVKLMRQKIYSHTFNGKTINDLANCCKHEISWFGQVSTNVDGVNDITDEFGKRLLRDVCIPVYIETTNILKRLGDMHNQPVSFPCI